MNLKDFTVQKIPNDKEHYYISNGDNIYVLKNGNVSPIPWQCYWESKKEAEIFLAGWLLLNRDYQGLYKLEREIAVSKNEEYFWIPTQGINTNRIDKEQQFPLGVQFIDVIGRTGTYYHKPKVKSKPEPEINIDQIDYEPQFKVGTRCIKYVNGIRIIHKYCKLDFGSLGYDTKTGIEYKNIQYCWFKVRG